MDKKAAFAGAIAGAIMAFGASFFFINKQRVAIDELKTQNPPIVVVDFSKIVSQYPEGAAENEINELMVRTNNAIVKLREAGYLVLDAQAVLSGPTELYLPTDAIAVE